MARKRRPKRPDTRQARAVPEWPRWKWRTMPVWLALTGGFVLGWWVAAVGGPAGISYLIQVAVLVVFALGLSRISNRWAARWWARRRLNRSRAASPSPPASRPNKGPQAPA